MDTQRVVDVLNAYLAFAGLGRQAHGASGCRCRAELDLAAEEEAVALYTEYVDLCRAEGDEESRVLFEGILQDERAHSETLRNLVEGRRA